MGRHIQGRPTRSRIHVYICTYLCMYVERGEPRCLRLQYREVRDREGKKEKRQAHRTLSCQGACYEQAGASFANSQVLFSSRCCATLLGTGTGVLDRK